MNQHITLQLDNEEMKENAPPLEPDMVACGPDYAIGDVNREIDFKTR